MERFHQQYVLVPADKAGNNIIIVCKKYYVEVIMNEMLNGGQPATYIASNDTYDQLVRRHLNDMKLWNITVPSVMEKLPSLYWMPKVHKIMVVDL